LHTPRGFDRRNSARLCGPESDVSADGPACDSTTTATDFPRSSARPPHLDTAPKGVVIPRRLALATWTDLCLGAEGAHMRWRARAKWCVVVACTARSLLAAPALSQDIATSHRDIQLTERSRH